MQAGAELKHWMFGVSGNRIKVIIHMAYGFRVIRFSELPSRANAELAA
ncbi:hypothetical protein [Bifidobacterium callitrichos]|nr:hypothetical protein [Bifidobacterium callitrichos]